MIRAPLNYPLTRPLAAALGRREGSDLYVTLRQAAIEAATRNNAAIWFVEQDRSNIFANSDGSGGTPTSGGVIGLVLPNRGTRGSELFAGGDGSSLGTWTTTGATVTLDNGEFRINTSAAFGGVSRVITTVVGRWYECRATYRNGTADAATIFLRPNGADSTTDQVQFPSNATGANVTNTRYFRATTTQVFIRLTSLRNGSGDVCYFDNLSFREVEGFTLDSATTSQKPSLVQGASGNLAFRFDGTDDRLRTVRSPLSATAGDPYTLVLAASPSLSGVRMGVSDGRGIGLGSTQWEILHGGTARHATGVPYAQNVPRVFSAVYRRTPDTLTAFIGGAQVFQADVAPTTSTTPEAFLGARSGTAEFFGGDVFLAFMAPSAISAADRRAVEQFGALLSGASYV